MEIAGIEALQEALRDYRAARQIERRIIRFEDNLARHIALTRHQWATYDWLISEFSLSEAELNHVTFLQAVEWPDMLPMYPMPFEHCLRICLADVIAVFTAKERRDRGDAANDNDQFWVTRERRL